MKSLMFAQGEFCEGTHAFNRFFLSIVTLEPDFMIGVGIGKSLEEGCRTFSMEIDGTNNICNRVKS